MVGTAERGASPRERQCFFRLPTMQHAEFQAGFSVTPVLSSSSGGGLELCVSPTWVFLHFTPAEGDTPADSYLEAQNHMVGYTWERSFWHVFLRCQGVQSPNTSHGRATPVSVLPAACMLLP